MQPPRPKSGGSVGTVVLVLLAVAALLGVWFIGAAASRLNGDGAQEAWDAKTRQTTAQPSPHSEITQLKAWMEENGAEISDVVAVVEKGGDRRIVASRATRAGDRLFAIPVKLGISGAKFARDAGSGRLLNEAASDLPAHQRLELLTGAALASGVAMDLYEKTLPRAFPTLPIVWPPEAAKECFNTSSTTLARVDRGRGRFEAAVNKMRDAFANSTEPVPSMERLRWAKQNSMTRGFSVHSPAGDDCLMLPFIDMFNHCSGPNVKWQCDDCDPANGQGVFEAVVVKATEPGKELCISYGGKTDLELFAHYGFFSLALAESPRGDRGQSQHLQRSFRSSARALSVSSR
mmetsp:Transcript_124696/g.285668  ORF Transcript_124696/g.285668 Transcript_124696/m.285668 type:complete len:347 (+) Transcript_124696:48-1088(+)